MEKINGTEKVERARNWTLIFYPNEGRADFREVLEKLDASVQGRNKIL